MTRIQSVKADESISVINKVLEQDGCIVLKDVMSKDNVNLLKNDLEPHFTETPNCHGNFYGFVTKRLSSLLVKSPECQSMAIHPAILSVMDEFLLRGCAEYQLNLTQAIRIGPGEPQQMLHLDDLMFPFAHQNYEAMINCMWAVDDFTEENGATHVVPGSHQWERQDLIPKREPEQEEIVQACMTSGSVLIYFGSLLHSGGANRSKKPRTGITISYNLGWLRQSENQYLAVPIDLAKAMSERLQRLLGYFVHTPNLGQIEGRNPIEILQGKEMMNAGFEEFIPEALQPMVQEHRLMQLKKTQ